MPRASSSSAGPSWGSNPPASRPGSAERDQRRIAHRPQCPHSPGRQVDPGTCGPPPDVRFGSARGQTVDPAGSAPRRVAEPVVTSLDGQGKATALAVDQKARANHGERGPPQAPRGGDPPQAPRFAARSGRGRVANRSSRGRRPAPPARSAVPERSNGVFTLTSQARALPALAVRCGGAPGRSVPMGVRPPGANRVGSPATVGVAPRVRSVALEEIGEVRQRSSGTS